MPYYLMKQTNREGEMELTWHQDVRGQLFISGLPQTEDHALVARAIEAYLR